MRHRTAARMSILTEAMVISVSERRQVVHVFIDGKGYQLRTVAELMGSVNPLIVAMQSTRSTDGKTYLSVMEDNLAVLKAALYRGTLPYGTNHL